MSRFILPAALAAIAFAGGCSSSTTPPRPAAGSPAATATATLPSPTAAASAAPAGTAPSAHRQGDKIVVSSGIVDATFFGYKQPVASGAPKPQQDGYVWGAADVQVCTEATQPAWVSRHPWALLFADNSIADPSSTGYGSFPLPVFPWDEREIQHGRCVRGWIVFPVPAAGRPTMVEYSPEGSTPVDWAVPPQ